MSQGMDIVHLVHFAKWGKIQSMFCKLAKTTKTTLILNKHICSHLSIHEGFVKYYSRNLKSIVVSIINLNFCLHFYVKLLRYLITFFWTGFRFQNHAKYNRLAKNINWRLSYRVLGIIWLLKNQHLSMINCCNRESE